MAAGAVAIVVGAFLPWATECGGFTGCRPVSGIALWGGRFAIVAAAISLIFVTSPHLRVISVMSAAGAAGLALGHVLGVVDAATRLPPVPDAPSLWPYLLGPSVVVLGALVVLIGWIVDAVHISRASDAARQPSV